jgi:hypothetical protein
VVLERSLNGSESERHERLIVDQQMVSQMSRSGLDPMMPRAGCCNMISPNLCHYKHAVAAVQCQMQAGLSIKIVADSNQIVERLLRYLASTAIGPAPNEQQCVPGQREHGPGAIANGPLKRMSGNERAPRNSRFDVATEIGNVHSDGVCALHLNAVAGSGHEAD